MNDLEKLAEQIATDDIWDYLTGIGSDMYAAEYDTDGFRKKLIERLAPIFAENEQRFQMQYQRDIAREKIDRMENVLIECREIFDYLETVPDRIWNKGSEAVTEWNNKIDSLLSNLDELTAKGVKND